MGKRPRQPRAPKPAAQPFNLLRWLRNSFFTGVVVTTPIAVTAYVVVTFIGFMDRTVKPLIPKVYNPETYLPFAIPGLGLIAAIVMLTMLGALAANIFGRSLLTFGEGFVDRVPLVRNIYSALKQIIETIAAQRERSFKEVVLLEFGDTGMHVAGFITSEAKGEIANMLGDEHISVFVPTAPNPTTGILFYVHHSKVRVVDMTPEEGAKLIISLGIVTPEMSASQAALLKNAGKKNGPKSEPASAGAEPGDGAVAVEEVEKDA